MSEVWDASFETGGKVVVVAVVAAGTAGADADAGDDGDDAIVKAVVAVSIVRSAIRALQSTSDQPTNLRTKCSESPGQSAKSAKLQDIDSSFQA